MGEEGAQIHIGKVSKLDPALKGGYLHNVVVSCQNQSIRSFTTGAAVEPAYTVYLSNASSTWDDNQVISARACNNGGNVSVSARRWISEATAASGNANGPVHIWIECTDITPSGIDAEARVTLEAWGRSVILEEDF